MTDYESVDIRRQRGLHFLQHFKIVMFKNYIVAQNIAYCDNNMCFAYCQNFLKIKTDAVHPIKKTFFAAIYNKMYRVFTTVIDMTVYIYYIPYFRNINTKAHFTDHIKGRPIGRTGYMCARYCKIKIILLKVFCEVLQGHYRQHPLFRFQELRFQG